MKWELAFLPEAAKDLKNLAGNQRIMVAKAIDKVLENPLPAQEGDTENLSEIKVAMI